MRVCINKSILGSDKHLQVSEDNFSWTLEHPSEASGFTYGFNNHPRSMEPLLTLHNITISEISSRSERNTFKSCGYMSVPPWPLVLGKSEFLKRAIGICDELKEASYFLEGQEYTDIFLSGNLPLVSLVDARVDMVTLKKQCESTENLTLKNYANLISGSISTAPTYNRVKTKTGRLTIKKGPPILTLPKSVRNAYTSQHKDGIIIEIDFTSLEPRCASNIAGNNFSDHDLYAYLKSHLEIEAGRDRVKEMVISLLYGAGDSRAKSILQKDSLEKNPEKKFQAVKDFFNLDEMKKMLTNQAKTGSLFNFFGRPITIDSLQPGVLVNNYIQSTAVDLSLLGFGDLIGKLDKRKAKPLFIIHDALIIDVMKDYIGEINTIAGDYYRHTDLGVFPWKIRSV